MRTAATHESLTLCDVTLQAVIDAGAVLAMSGGYEC